MSELATLNEQVTATIRQAIPAFASVATADHGGDSMLPALRHAAVRMVADTAPRDGRSVVITTFEATITTDAQAAEHRLQGSLLAAQLVDLLRQQLWGLDFVEATRDVQADFALGQWTVRWAQPVLLGTAQWAWPDEPAGSLMLGFSPDTGVAHREDYVAPGSLP